MTVSAPPDERGQPRVAFRISPHGLILAVLLAMMGLAGLIFYLSPTLDLRVAALFTDASGHFFVADTLSGKVVREIAAAAPFLILAGMIVAYVANRIGKPIGRAPSLRSLIFLVFSFALIPGVVVNLGMKNHLDRPRPVHVTEFGGSHEYRQFYQWDGTCIRNCSFPSGEASATFWLVAPASLAPLPYRPAAIAAAIAFGTVTSLLRIAFGGHFLSDVVFAALITASLVVVLHWLIMVRGRRLS